MSIDQIHLVKPQEASEEVKEVFADIVETKGAKYLTPTWGFFALDPELLKHWWGLTKRLQMTDGACSKTLLNSISLICAGEVDCPRCINNHQVHLMDHFGMSEEYVQAVLQFEESDLIENDVKVALRFARKVAFAEGTTEEDFHRLRSAGYSDIAIAEIVSMAMLESGMARRAVGVAPFEDGEEWPRDNLPSDTYGENVNA